MSTDYSLNSTTNSTPTSQLQNKASLLTFIVFFTGILYYCFAYLLRVYPNVMEPNLLQHFHIDAGGFGVLTTFYYFAYAPMQLPVGVSVDKIGPRKSLIMACIIATLGAGLFAMSHIYALALAGRFLIGFGSAFAYVTALKLASVWLPRKYFATATGCLTGFGMVAAIFTEMGLTHMVQTDGYHATLQFPLFIGVVLFVLILCIVRDKPKSAKIEDENYAENFALSYAELGRYLLQIFKKPQMWIIGIIGALLYMPASVFLDVWAIPYLKAAFSFTPEQAASGVSVMLAGWIISTWIAGALSDLLGTRKIPLIMATLGATVIASVLIYMPHSAHVSHLLVYTLLFVFGACCGPHPLTFALSKENNEHKISGTAVAFANFVIMMGGFIFQPVVGWLLDLRWQHVMHNGVPYYSAGDYVFALSILPIGLLVAFLLTLTVKETYKNTH